MKNGDPNPAGEKPKKRRRHKLRVAHNKPPVGSQPGTLALPEDSPKPRIRAVLYGPEELEEREIQSEKELRALCERRGVLWVDVQGLGDQATLEWIAASFGLHPLVLSDVVHISQRPKAEAYGDEIFTIARRLAWKGEPPDLVDERQISLVIGAKHLLSFQEREDAVFEPVRARIERGNGILRTSGTDYLAYALLDAVVDNYLPILDRIGESLENLEERVLDCPSRELMSELAILRRQLIAIRRYVWPQREALNALMRGDVGHISDPVKPYLRDVHDHCVQVAEMVEVYREIVSGIQNIYLTALANRTNEVMKVLTVVSTVFIPLTFLVGVWGMNFKYMPELELPWAYPAVWVLMLAIGAGLWVFFARRGWIGRAPE